MSAFVRTLMPPFFLRKMLSKPLNALISFLIDFLKQIQSLFRLRNCCQSSCQMVLAVNRSGKFHLPQGERGTV